MVLAYPIPEVGWDVPAEVRIRASQALGATTSLWTIPQAIRKRLLPEPSSWPLQTPVTTSYDVYVNRSRSTFDVLDSITGDRIIRIYPHKVFCDDENVRRCVTHDDDNIFYADDDHLSDSGALLLTNEIMKEILHLGSKP